VTAIDIEVLPKQHEFLTSTAREVLYSGAFGAGKTRATCLKAVMRASHPGAREGLCRKHFSSLRASTLKTLLEPSGELPPVLPRHCIESHNKSEHIIKLRGGGTIMYFGCDNPDKLGSYELTGCGCDEVVEFTLADYTMLQGRIRIRVDGVPNQLYGACNPGAPSHWLAEHFGLAAGHQPSSDCHAIRTKTTDNTFLPVDYVASLERLTGTAHKRYVCGEWVGSEGMVYDRWSRERHVKPRKRSDMVRYHIGIDVGYSNPCAMLVIGQDGDGRLHVFREWYETRQVEQDVIAAARELDRRWHPDWFVVDPSAAEFIEAMQREGLNALAGDNAVWAGIQEVQQRLQDAGDGQPRLTVDPGCENLIREFESYEWATDRAGQAQDKPVKQFDHALDALRYDVMMLSGSENSLWVG
jgi:phage terminase large subunit